MIIYFKTPSVSGKRNTVLTCDRNLILEQLHYKLKVEAGKYLTGISRGDDLIKHWF